MKLFNRTQQPQRQEYEMYTISLSKDLYNKIETLRKTYGFDTREDFLKSFLEQVNL